MMRETPRTFVGPVVFVVDETGCGHLTDTVCSEISRLPGVGSCDLDLAAGTLVVTARTPVDRTDVVAALDRLGCHIRV